LSTSVSATKGYTKSIRNGKKANVVGARAILGFDSRIISPMALNDVVIAKILIQSTMMS
jgi:hypothetical protein